MKDIIVLLLAFGVCFVVILFLVAFTNLENIDSPWPQIVSFLIGFASFGTARIIARKSGLEKTGEGPADE